jgi:predicted O-methyltransferase YrrM
MITPKEVPTPSHIQYAHPGFTRPDFAGPVFGLIEQKLGSIDAYRSFRSGELPLASYLAFLEGRKRELINMGLTENQCHLTTRFPVSEEDFVDRSLQRLHDAGMIPSISYPKSEFSSFREAVYTQFDHSGYLTFIFPEEERLLFALSYILRPKSALFLGSYYGYWGLWMMPAIRAFKGSALFVDPNTRTNEVARSGLHALGFARCSEVADAEGTALLAANSRSSNYDLLLLDAEGPDDIPEPEFRGKHVYLPLVRSAMPHLRKGATVIVHNILLANDHESSYFDELIKKNQSELYGFLAFAQEHFSMSMEIDSTEGVGVYRL